jgi:FMN-dependent dehydrogenase
VGVAPNQQANAIMHAVGIGRPFLYAFSAYGQEGVEHALSILRVSVSWRFLDYLSGLCRTSSR